MKDLEVTTGGYTFRLAHLAFALPILSGVAGGAYWGYDVLNRFLAVESGFEKVVGATSRIQALEQTIEDNDVDALSAALAGISTQMTTILEQQKALLDLRSQVEKSTTITDKLGDDLEKYDQEIDDLWDAMDELYNNPLK